MSETFNTDKKHRHEGKSKTVNVTKNLDGHLSFDHIVPFCVWSKVILTTIVPTNFYPYYFAGAMDDVYWYAGFRFPDKRSFPKNGVEITS